MRKAKVVLLTALLVGTICVSGCSNGGSLNSSDNDVDAGSMVKDALVGTWGSLLDYESGDSMVYLRFDEPENNGSEGSDTRINGTVYFSCWYDVDIFPNDNWKYSKIYVDYGEMALYSNKGEYIIDTDKNKVSIFAPDRAKDFESDKTEELTYEISDGNVIFDFEKADDLGGVYCKYVSKNTQYSDFYNELMSASTTVNELCKKYPECVGNN